ncbi:hypothetical protein FCK19_22380 [Salmonella enterica]|nr:hypothetical protein [Salmonella enterica]
MFLVGCSVRDKKIPSVPQSKISVVDTGVASESLDDAARMERCQRELEALKKINSAIYTKRKQEFDALMSGAGIYTGVREDVSTYTQKAVDAYYRYHADKLCADIAIDVLSNLAKAK